MILVIVHHYIEPGKKEEAEKRVLENGRVMRSFPGFITRHTGYSQKDPLKLSTVTLWRTRENYEAWRNSPERQQLAGSGPAPWSSPPEAEVFDVVPEL